VRVPFADTSTHVVPDGVSDQDVLMLADILPTGYEVGSSTDTSNRATWSRWWAPARLAWPRSWARSCSP
jgi:hypothetical protein